MQDLVGSLVCDLTQISYNFQRENGMSQAGAAKLFNNPLLRERGYLRLKDSHGVITEKNNG